MASKDTKKGALPASSNATSRKENGHWQIRNCKAVLHITSRTACDTEPEDLLAHLRGRWWGREYPLATRHRLA